MDSGLKQRLIGAAVLIALAVIFLPMLVQGPAPDSGVSDLSLQVPSAPGGQYETRDLPLVVPNASSSAGLLADDGSMATVDTATAPPPADTPSDAAADLSSAEPLLEEDGVVATPLPPEPAAGTAVATAPVAAAPAVQTPATPPTKPAANAARPVDAPAAVAATPATRLPPATAGGDYVVSFGAYATRADAGAVVDRLRKASLPGYVEETTVNGRDAWRVRIGPYASRADAESARITAGGIGSRAQAQVVALDARAPAATAARPVAAASTPPKPAAGTPSPVQAAPAATPAAAAPTAGTGFAVQLGAFGSAADAQALRDRLRAAGIGAFTDTVQTDKGALTRVKAGPVLTRAEAEQLKARIKASQGIDGLVRAHP